MLRKLFLTFLLVLTVTQLAPANAENFGVTTTVGDTVLILTGYTSPNSLVTFVENSAVVGNTVSDANGEFSKEFTGLDPGPKTMALYSIDPDSRLTRTIEFSMILIQFQTLTIDSIYLPPTFAINKSSFLNQDSLVASGYSYKDAMVNLEISGQEGYSKLVQANSAGFFQTEVKLADFEAGSYQIYFSVQVSASANPTDSEVVSFTISPNPTSAPAGSTTTGETATTAPPTPSPTPLALICPYRFANLCFFDQSKLGYLRIENLSDYLLGFVNNFFKPKVTVWDINEDGTVDGADLSIVLYHANISPQQILGLSLPTKSSAKVLGSFSPGQAPVIGYNESRNYLFLIGVVGLLVFGTLLFIFYRLTIKRQHEY
jgi:hypothetical protein